MILLQKKYIPYYVILGLLIYIFMIGKKEKIEVVIPLKSGTVKILNPVSEVRVDTVFIDSTNKKKGFRVVEVENPKNKELEAAYKEALKNNDSLKQAALFYSSITERKYSERLEDSIQVVTVESEVIGTLKNQKISYKTKPQIISLGVKKEKPVVYIGGFVNLTNKEDLKRSAGVQVQVANKKRVLTIGFDNQKTILVGYSLKLF